MNYEFLFLTFALTAIIITVILAITIVAVSNPKPEIVSQAIKALAGIGQSAIKKIKDT